MKQVLVSIITIGFLLTGLSGGACSFGQVKDVAKVQKQSKSELSTTPVDRKAKWWQNRHQQKMEGLKKNQDLELLFIGDSITHGFEGQGKEVWKKYYQPRKAFNIGYSGDRTEHVLWRFENGELDGIAPKLSVIMIGTNNTGHRREKPEAIASGIKKILEKLKAKCPKTKVLLLAIFPRGAKADHPMRVNNTKANRLIEKFADPKNGIHYLSINKKFLEKDGTLPKSIMPDLLHPNKKGYQIWAESIEPKIKELMGEK